MGGMISQFTYIYVLIKYIVYVMTNHVKLSLHNAIVGVMTSQSPASRLFIQPFIQAEIKENTEAPRHWPLCEEFTGDRRIPRTKGQ